ncbi:hypothetical protein [Mesorhizobium mediterraneum]|uniref:hypothetical protein n=1 Tax=Mesorhizobium mediterraneum TaxID=43617 RepID=UPI00177CB77A|nr:hypothetical protein [Mesorhizobium mediterraneum]
MPFLGTVDPDQSIITRALDEHCQTIGIPPDSVERENLASRVLALFGQGVTTLEDLKRALASDSTP